MGRLDRGEDDAGRVVASSGVVALQAGLTDTDGYGTPDPMVNPITHASTRLLAVLAAVVWYIGAMVLSIKGASLLAEAAALRPGSVWPGLAAGLAISAGILKAILLFRKSCRKNLDRIARLPQPRIWQFFRPGFFLALALMITAGAMMSRMAHGSFTPLLWVGGLDLSIAVALFGSSLEFWRQKSFARS